MTTTHDELAGLGNYEFGWADPAERSRLLAEALTADGYAASTRDAEKLPGEQLCQHHCPVAHVAEEFPQLCEAETEVFAKLLGTHVQRLATIAHGDGVCTTFIPNIPKSKTSTSPTDLAPDAAVPIVGGADVFGGNAQ